MKSCKENMKVDIFDKPFLIKNIGCRTEATSGGFIPPSINLFVKVTNNCNAGCHFCSNGYHAYDRLGFNLEKLWHIIDILIANQIIVNRVNITGGDLPSLQILFIRYLIRLRKINIHRFISISIQTDYCRLLKS